MKKLKNFEGELIVDVPSLISADTSAFLCYNTDMIQEQIRNASPASEKKLSIIVPVFNEENLLAQSLPAICRLTINKEVIVVDDGSSDRTPEILASLQKDWDFRLIRQEPNQGKGAAVKRGLEVINGDYFIVCDADLEYEPTDISRLFKRLCSLDKENNANKTALFGSRFLNKPPLSFHYLVNRFLTELTNILFRVRLTDMETCFKLIPTEALRLIRLKGRRFEIEPEITARLIKAGYEIKELPISYARRSYAEGKKITAKDGVLAVITIFQERLKR